MTSDRNTAKARAKSKDDLDTDRTGVLDDAKDFNAKINAEKRQDSQQNHLHRVFVFGIYAVGVMLILCLFSLLFHYSAPKGWRFLEASDVDRLQAFLFSGTVGSLMTAGAKKILK